MTWRVITHDHADVMLRTRSPGWPTPACVLDCEAAVAFYHGLSHVGPSDPYFPQSGGVMSPKVAGGITGAGAGSIAMGFQFADGGYEFTLFDRAAQSSTLAKAAVILWCPTWFSGLSLNPHLAPDDPHYPVT